MRMPTLSIRTTMLAASLLPVMLIATAMTTLSLTERFADMDTDLELHGFGIVRELAGAAEFGVFSRNPDSLASLAQVFGREDDVIGVMITDAKGQVLAGTGALLPLQDVPRGRAPLLQRDPLGDRLVFTAPILATDLLGNDAYAAMGFNTETGAEPPPLGHVTLSLSRQRLKATQRRLLLVRLAISLAGTLAAAVLAVVLSRRVAGPVLEVAQTVERIGRGELSARVRGETRGILKRLAAGVNDMAARLDAAQTNLRREVADATARLLEKKDEAERANQAKSRFLAAASHDLRQPMHALNLFAARLAASPHSPDDAELIRAIDGAAQAMSDLLDALLDISRLDAGELEVNRTDFAAAEVLDRIRDSFSVVAREKGLTLRVVPSSLWLHSDPVVIKRIVMNFVANAIRYTPEGTVLVACRRRHDGVRIEVRDSGIGIPEDAHQMIFEEFVQLANPQRDRARGLGLGLAIVQRLAGLLGHPLSLRSAPGRGSVFAIDVPAGEPRPPGAETIAEDRLGLTSLDGRVVLVVDDDPAARAGMVALLENWGCRPIAGAGAETVAELCAAAHLTPEVALCDYRLADGQTGIDAVARLRARFGAGLPAALISGDSAPEVVRLARAHGLVLMLKPTPPARLRTLLTRLLPPVEPQECDAPAG